MKKVLTVAGSDSCGGAGIQADLKTIALLGAHGMSAVTALTAQNTTGVQGIHAVPAEFVGAQLESVISDARPDAVKTGMLAEPDVVRVVSRKIFEHKLPNVVVDPVLFAKGGERLLEEEAERLLQSELLPLAEVVTPNLLEAGRLAGVEVASLDDAKLACRRIYERGARHVLVKGGHLADLPPIDILYDGRDFNMLASERVAGEPVHGTGCTFSAALAVGLAKGNDVLTATRLAKQFMTDAIRAAAHVGAGLRVTDPYFAANQAAARERLLDEVSSALTELAAHDVGALVPEVRMNLAACEPWATGLEDVVAVPGRITAVGKRIGTAAAPAFGASAHVARLLLAARELDASIGAAANIRYSQAIVSACKDAGFSVADVDREGEPQSTQLVEGRSLGWAVREAFGKAGRVPDVIYDLGAKGKEPMARVFGTHAMAVARKIIRISQQLARMTGGET